MNVKNNTINPIQVFLFKRKFTVLGLFIIYCTLGVILNFQNELLHHLFPKKIWIHRVNSIEKLQEVHKNFEGIEVDVVYQTKSQSFDVNHPPTPSINLSLFKYLSAIKRSPTDQFWIDFKNLSQKNVPYALTRLNIICKKLHLNPNQFIIEAKIPEYLTSFGKSGYKTSYYLPYSLSQPNNNALINQTKKNNTLYGTDYISSGIWDYDLLKKEFPNQKILTWSFNFSERKSINPYQLLRKTNAFYSKLKILSDDNIAIVLFGYKAKKGNR